MMVANLPLRSMLAALLIVQAVPAVALDVRELTSPAGTGFWLVEETSIPIVALEISFAGGARLDPEDRAGLAGMMAGLIEEGAGDLDAVAFAKARDYLSARFSFSGGRDGVEVSARMLAENLAPGVDLLATALASPRFDPEPVERVRSQILSLIAESETDPGDRASEAWFAEAFHGHPYARPAQGTKEGIAAIDQDDLIAAHARLLTRANARIAIVGAVDADAAGRMVDTILAGLPKGEPVARIQFEFAAQPGLKVIELDVPQSTAIFGQAGILRDDPDFIPAYVMNYILGGGGFASRLMVEVREKRGLAYSVYSYLANLDEVAVYMGGVQTANERLSESLKVIKAEWARMAEGGITEEDLDSAKKYLTGAFPLSFDSNSKIANYLVFMQEESLGIDYIDRRNDLIEAVTVEDVKRVARRLLKPEGLFIVVVGKPEGLN